MTSIAPFFIFLWVSVKVVSLVHGFGGGECRIVRTNPIQMRRLHVRQSAAKTVLQAKTDTAEEKLGGFSVSSFVPVNNKAALVAEGGQAPRRARAHTKESRAKISAANKGKRPWNAGIQHSEETKRKISERTRSAILKKKIAAAAAAGLSLVEYEAQKAEEKRARAASKRKGGLTDEGRKKISDSLKARWADPGYRAAYSAAMVGKRRHSEETRARISAAIKEKWNDDEYRAKISLAPSAETRSRISATLKAKWEDPEFRAYMMNRTFERTDEWRQAISRGVKARWQDPSYQTKVRTRIKETSSNAAAARKGASAKKKKKSGPRKLDTGEAKRRKAERKHATVQKERVRKQALNAAMKASKAGKASLKELLGNEAWFEEKLRRTREGDPFIDDASLERQLGEEWNDADSDGMDYSGNGDDDNNDGDDDVHEWDMYEDEYIEQDIIEVYDEEGTLVGSFNAQEYERLRNAR